MNIKLEDLDNPEQVARWNEVLDHACVVIQARWDEVDEGFLWLTLDPEDAQTWGLYPELIINLKGGIAEYTVSRFYYKTFAELITAANVRTAAG